MSRTGTSSSARPLIGRSLRCVGDLECRHSRDFVVKLGFHLHAYTGVRCRDDSRWRGVGGDMDGVGGGDGGGWNGGGWNGVEGEMEGNGGES